MNSNVPHPSVSAATLTYDVAPFPLDNMENMFESLLLRASDVKRRQQLQSTWYSKAWAGVKNFVTDRAVTQRQIDFLKYFSRQLEPNLHPEVENVVLLSCRCALLSLGQPQVGTLYLTPQGVFFGSDTYAEQHDRRDFQANTTLNSSAPVTDSEDSSGASDVSLRLDQWALEGREVIKDHLEVRCIASVLPSVVLPVKPNRYSDVYVVGIPNPIVLPTAIQVFTVKPNQIFQFLRLYDLVIRPPDPSNPSYDPSGRQDKVLSEAEVGTQLTEVLTFTEYDLIKLFPEAVEAIIVTALLNRLVKSYKIQRNMPLLHPKAIYAEPH